MYGMALSVVIGGACVVARVVLWTNVWFRWWFAIGGGLGVLVWGLAHFGVKDMKDAAEEGASHPILTTPILTTPTATG